jgi:radical SAM superfamily enzyme
MLITGLKRVTWNTRLGMLFSSDSKSSADGGGNCSRVGSENEQSKRFHKNSHNISKNTYKLITYYFTQNYTGRYLQNHRTLYQDIRFLQLQFEKVTSQEEVRGRTVQPASSV